jgi:uncharacterized membrane protein (UPF0127 family)
MKVFNMSKNIIIGDKVSLADNFYSRLFGLIPRKSISTGEGLIIDPCNSIHMFFMRFPIDVLFVDKNNVVVYIVENIKPWRISKVVWNSKYVVELPVGTVKKASTTVGDKIKIERD